MNKRQKKKETFKDWLKRFVTIKHAYLLLLVVISIGICGVYFSYALFSASVEKKGALNIVTGNLYTYLTSDALNSSNRITVAGSTTKTFDLVLENINSVDAKFNLYYKGTTTLPSTVKVGYSGINDAPPSASGTTISKYGSSSNKKTVRVVIENKSYTSYTIEFGSAVGLSNTSISVPSGYTALTQVVDIPNAPVLEEGMIPVRWNGSYWVKTTLTDKAYYDYSDQQWANAVIMQPCAKRGDADQDGVVTIDDVNLVFAWAVGAETKPSNAVSLADVNDDGSINSFDASLIQKIANGQVTVLDGEEISTRACKYKTPGEYAEAANSTIIYMEDIQSMWVWIPRYEYQYTNLGTSYAGGTKAQPGEIKVNFLEDTRTKVTSSSYKVHPAFNFGGEELEGIWVGKFETGYRQDGWDTSWTKTGAEKNTTDEDRVVIKPNVYSWRNNTLSHMHTVALANDSHLMKNSEWGAVAYLTQSRYGKYGNSSYSGANKEVYKNSNNTYKTGCSGGSPTATSSTTCYTYSSSTSGTGASSTGTVYGVYDMNGGTREYTMGNYNGTIGSSGFSSLPNSKYYDRYTSTTVSSACSGGVCYGHALSETSGWYNDGTDTLSSSYPWYTRGGYNADSTSTSGIFRMYTRNGSANVSNGFRFVRGT